MTNKCGYTLFNDIVSLVVNFNCKNNEMDTLICFRTDVNHIL
ncbi:hypothetical protein SAMN05660226_03658 [Parapedobacter luteus]|uniref:Uncharacterized protein n=1 Tax=Parapedobacter luteus TaxID=623280 RepID=A0A1T5EZL2_9SPHI|nr:hypothetical protein SAMN05660226_03658 [Parapedobacter luteus]